MRQIKKKIETDKDTPWCTPWVPISMSLTPFVTPATPKVSSFANTFPFNMNNRKNLITKNQFWIMGIDFISNVTFEDEFLATRKDICERQEKILQA